MEAVTGRKRVRRNRSASESLLSIVLALEVFLVFFATLAVFSLGAVAPATALVGGGSLLVLLAFTAALTRYQWAVWLGWFFQLALLACGLLTPPMFFVGAVFATMWVYCFVAGRRLDRRNAASPSSASAVPASSVQASAVPTKENP